MQGCCDQNILVSPLFYVKYVLGTDDGAKGREAEVSIAWMKTLGIGFINLSGPGSTEPYKDFRNFTKYDGFLPERWRDGGDVIYEVPQHSSSLAHIVTRDEIVREKPINGVEIEPLRAYLRALDDPARPEASFEWVGNREARIRGTFRPEDLLSVQISYHKGWRAEGPAKISKDAIDLMVVEPHCTGACEVRLIFDGGTEYRVLRYVCGVAWLGLMVLLISGWRRT
jgi:hypothetical protein